MAGILIRGLRTVQLESVAVSLNGAPACRFVVDDGRQAAVSVVVEDGRITRIYIIANPHKLAGIDEIANVTRT